MSESRPPEDDPARLSEASLRRAKVRKEAQKTQETARETVATTHRILDKSRQLITKTEELLRHHQAWRERESELGRPPAPATPLPGSEILFIEESRADERLFRYALHECGFPCEVKVLTHWREVETFMRQAATQAHPPLPTLIITASKIPGMEIEDILAAVRMVPSYRHIPVLVFSGLEEESGQRRSAQCGATAFIHKPDELGAFINAVGSSRVDLQACKLEYSIVSPK